MLISRFHTESPISLAVIVRWIHWATDSNSINCSWSFCRADITLLVSVTPSGNLAGSYYLVQGYTLWHRQTSLVPSLFLSTLPFSGSFVILVVNNLNILIGCLLWWGFEDRICLGSPQGVPKSPSEDEDCAQVVVDRKNTARWRPPNPVGGGGTQLSLWYSGKLSLPLLLN